jgi:predicted lipoprotein with Yx(FWY)xxD motif
MLGALGSIRVRVRERRAAQLKTLGVAIVVLAAMSAVAVAASTTLATRKASVKGKTKTVVVDARGATLYMLSGESVGHRTRLKCLSSACLKAWPPYKTTRTAKLAKASGIKGTLGRLHRVKAKLYQVTLGGHPLYTFVGDNGKKGSAKGDGLTAFGGTWHVVAP